MEQKNWTQVPVYKNGAALLLASEAAVSDPQLDWQTLNYLGWKSEFKASTMNNREGPYASLQNVPADDSVVSAPLLTFTSPPETVNMETRDLDTKRRVRKVVIVEMITSCLVLVLGVASTAMAASNNSLAYTCTYSGSSVWAPVFVIIAASLGLAVVKRPGSLDNDRVLLAYFIMSIIGAIGSGFLAIFTGMCLSDASRMLHYVDREDCARYCLPKPVLRALVSLEVLILLGALVQLISCIISSAFVCRYWCCCGRNSAATPLLTLTAPAETVDMEPIILDTKRRARQVVIVEMTTSCLVLLLGIGSTILAASNDSWMTYTCTYSGSSVWAPILVIVAASLGLAVAKSPGSLYNSRLLLAYFLMSIIGAVGSGLLAIFTGMCLLNISERLDYPIWDGCTYCLPKSLVQAFLVLEVFIFVGALVQLLTCIISSALVCRYWCCCGRNGGAGVTVIYVPNQAADIPGEMHVIAVPFGAKVVLLAGENVGQIGQSAASAHASEKV